MANYERSPARMIFAAELRNSTFAFTEGDGQYATTHVVSPTGEDIHRVLLIGAATEKEDIGTDSEYWRIRAVDPSGSILAYAGTYQPEAMLQAAELNVPSYVAVTGKLRLYTTEDDTVISSIQAENIVPVDRVIRDQFIYFAARNLITRLLEPDESSKTVILAKEQYQADVNEYFKMAYVALESLKK